MILFGWSYLAEVLWDAHGEHFDHFGLCLQIEIKFKLSIYLGPLWTYFGPSRNILNSFRPTLAKLMMQKPPHILCCYFYITPYIHKSHEIKKEVPNRK